MKYKVYHNPGELIRELRSSGSYYYLDQLDPGETWVGASNFTGNYLRKYYNLTSQQYYNIVMYGDINIKLKCPWCDKERSFGKIGHGYNITCGSPSCNSKQSNKTRVESGTHNFLTENGGSETMSMIQQKLVAEGKHPFQNPKVRELQRLKNLEVQHNLIENGIHPFQKFESRAKSNRSSESKYLSNYNKIYLYKAEFNPKLDGYIKLGVTYNPEIRVNENRYPLSNIETLLYSDREFILDLELDLKLRYADRDIYDKLSITEAYPIQKLDEILQFINEYKDNYKGSSTTIENQEIEK